MTRKLRIDEDVDLYGNISHAGNFGRYNKANGEMLKAAGYIPIDVTIHVVEEE